MLSDASNAIKIRSWTGAVGFAAFLVSLAIVSATTLAYFMFPSDMKFVGVQMAFYITWIVACPLCLFVAWIIKNSTNLATELENMLAQDRLTGLATRDLFFGELAQSSEKQGVVLLLDLDHFSGFNDEHGHLAGDYVLQHVAELIAAEMRSRDIACRFGGEEFALFLDQLGPVQARNTAERLRLNIARQPMVIEGKKFPITVSIGASFRHSGHEIETALAEADKSLFEAKKQGRNRTILATKSSGLSTKTKAA